MIIDILTWLEAFGVNFRQIVIGREGQIKPRLLHKALAVFGVAGKGFLTQIEVQNRHPMPHARQSGRHVDRDGGFARTALFVPDNNDMRHGLCPLPIARFARN